MILLFLIFIRSKNIQGKKIKINIMWIANFKKQKQPELFLKLAKSMKNQENVNLLMAGRLNNNKY